MTELKQYRISAKSAAELVSSIEDGVAGGRLLPGERVTFRAEYPAELKAGRYRALASFQYEEKVITNSRDFTVP